MKIKKIEWEIRGSDAFGLTPFGEYTVEEAPEDSTWDSPFVWSFQGNYLPVKSIEDGKKKASKDFKERILRCLESD